MQRLALLLKEAIGRGVIAEPDLMMSEPDIIAKLTADSATAEAWAHYCSIREIIVGEPGPDALVVPAKKRCINPYVQNIGRVTDLDKTYSEELQAFWRIPSTIRSRRNDGHLFVLTFLYFCPCFLTLKITAMDLSKITNMVKGLAGNKEVKDAIQDITKDKDVKDALNQLKKDKDLKSAVTKITKDKEVKGAINQLTTAVKAETKKNRTKKDGRIPTVSFAFLFLCLGCFCTVKGCLLLTLS